MHNWIRKRFQQWNPQFFRKSLFTPEPRGVPTSLPNAKKISFNLKLQESKYRTEILTVIFFLVEKGEKKRKKNIFSDDGNSNSGGKDVHRKCKTGLKGSYNSRKVLVVPEISALLFPEDCKSFLAYIPGAGRTANCTASGDRYDTFRLKDDNICIRYGGTN